MCNFGWQKLFTFLLTFSLSLFLTVLLIKYEEPNQIVEKTIILPENVNKKCSAKISQNEFSPFYQTYAELIQKRTELKLWLQNNENVVGTLKNNQLIRLAQLEKSIVEQNKIIDSLEQYRNKRKIEYTPPQNLLYIENCYEF
jgi:hypothetical protein